MKKSISVILSLVLLVSSLVIPMSVSAGTTLTADEAYAQLNAAVNNLEPNPNLYSSVDNMNFFAQPAGSTITPNSSSLATDADGVIDNGNVTLDDPGDKTIIGNSTPRYRYNIQGGIEWHGFSIRALFEGVGKRDLWTGSDLFWGFSRGIYHSNVTQYHIDNTWTYENPTAYYPRLNANGNKRSKQVQTKYLQDASYIRLKDLTIGYNLPRKWVNRIKAENINIYASGLNLWEKTHMPPFMTPDIVDQITGGGKSIQSENAGKEYAFMRSYSFGVNITF